MICPQVVFFDLCPFYYQEGFLHMLGRKFLEKIDKNCNRLCVTEKKKKQTMHVHYCTITKSKSNHGSFKPQISGIHVCIIIWKHYIHKKKPSGLVVPGTHKGLLFICERIHTGQWPEEARVKCVKLYSRYPFFVIRWGLNLCDIAEKNNHWKFVTEENQIHDLRILTIL